LNANEAQTEVRFVGEPDFIDALVAEAQASAGAMQIVDRSAEDDPTTLGFDIAALQAAVALVKDLAPIAGVVLAALRRSKPKRIVVQTPYYSVTIEYKDDLTQEEIAEVLRRLSRPLP
jgi:hypothetical protein